MTCDLATHGRRGALQASGDITDRRTGSEPPRNVLSLNHCERQQRAPTKRWNNPTVMRQQTVNGGMRPVKGAPNRMQRLSRFPAAPYVSRAASKATLRVFPLRSSDTTCESKLHISASVASIYLSPPSLPEKSKWSQNHFSGNATSPGIGQSRNDNWRRESLGKLDQVCLTTAHARLLLHFRPPHRNSDSLALAGIRSLVL